MYVKTLLASNLAFGLIAMPAGMPTIPSNSNLASIQNASLIIPQNELNTAFNITDQKPEPKIQFPLEFEYISQKFSFYHPAIDLVAEYGTVVKPILPGTVEDAGFSPFGYGNMILIDHGNGIESLYAHLSKLLVKKGEKVDSDTLLGFVGLTGHTTGPHLHLEIHKNGFPTNPLTFLQNTNPSDSKLLSSK